MLKYNQLIENKKFRTGDLLLFSHKNNFSSCCNCLFTFFTNLIKCCTNSKYSHSAIIIEGKDLVKLGIYLGPSVENEEYFVLQSSYESFPDAENDELKLGVEIVSFQKLYNSYQGKIFWRHIQCRRDQQFYYKFAQAHSTVHNRPYDTDIIDWIKAAFQIKIGNVQKLNEFWCSALVAFVYTQLNFFDKNTDWTLISPVMLSQGSKYPRFKNCSINDEIQIL